MENNSQVVITGGSSGLGKAFARHYAGLGYKVLIVGRSESTLEDTCRELNGELSDKRVSLFICDLSDTEKRKRLSDYIKKQHQLQVLINNAGYTIDGDFERIKLTDHLAMNETLINAPTELTHSSLPALLKNQGTLINVSSIAAFIPTPQSPLYGASKRFLHQLSLSLTARYQSQGLKVISVCPGFIRTNFHRKLGLDPKRFYRSKGLLRAHSAKDVAKRCLSDIQKGRHISIKGWNYRAIYLLLRGTADFVHLVVAKKTSKARM